MIFTRCNEKIFWKFGKTVNKCNELSKFERCLLVALGSMSPRHRFTRFWRQDWFWSAILQTWNLKNINKKMLINDNRMIKRRHIHWSVFSAACYCIAIITMVGNNPEVNNFERWIYWLIFFGETGRTSKRCYTFGIAYPLHFMQSLKHARNKKYFSLYYLIFSILHQKAPTKSDPGTLS